MKKIALVLAGIFAMLLIGCGGGSETVVGASSDGSTDAVVNTPNDDSAVVEKEVINNSLSDGPPMLPEDANN